MVLHAAALTNVREIEIDPIASYDINVCGTINVIKACERLNKRLVFISTDYVFDGEKGSYEVGDPLNPLSNYAKTKAAAELLVRTYKNSLVIRTSFFGYEFPYSAALVDQWSSKDYVDIIAPKILTAALENHRGIVHVGGERRSIYEIAKNRNKNVDKMLREDIDVAVPKDTSFA